MLLLLAEPQVAIGQNMARPQLLGAHGDETSDGLPCCSTVGNTASCSNV